MKSFSSNIVDSLFATSKADLTPAAYVKHRAHIAAPKPLSAREVEMESVLAAQREAEKAYQGNRTRVNNTGREIGFPWNLDVEDAVRALVEPGDRSTLVIIVSGTYPFFSSFSKIPPFFFDRKSIQKQKS
jgi:twinfilin